MKKILLILCLLFCASTSIAAEYVHIEDNPLRIKKLPFKWTFADGSMTGNFNLMEPSVLIAEGWRKITVDNSPRFNRRLQTAGRWNITVFADHAEKDRVVTDRDLETVRAEVRSAIKSEGVNILLAKWDLRKKQLGFNTAAENAAMNADKVALINYFKNIIKPLINNATTVQELGNLTNGNGYTWLALEPVSQPVQPVQPITTGEFNNADE